jgi:hypothetical protein
MDHDTFEPLGRWEVDRGPQYLAYDFWWHLGYDTMVTSEWGTPNMVEGGLDPLVGRSIGRRGRHHAVRLERLILRSLRPSYSSLGSSLDSRSCEAFRLDLASPDSMASPLYSARAAQGGLPC